MSMMEKCEIYLIYPTPTRCGKIELSIKQQRKREEKKTMDKKLVLLRNRLNGFL